MIQRHYPIMLLTLMTIQMTGVFYALFNPPQTYSHANYDARELTKIIKKELSAHLHQIENNEINPAAFTVATNEQPSHDALRSLLQEEFSAFLEKLQSNLASTEVAKPQQKLANNTFNASRVNNAPNIEKTLADSHEIIDNAISAGTWSSMDEMALNSRMQGLSEINQRELLDKFFHAIGQKKINIKR